LPHITTGADLQSVLEILVAPITNWRQQSNAPAGADLQSVPGILVAPITNWRQHHVTFCTFADHNNTYGNY